MYGQTTTATTTYSWFYPSNTTSNTNVVFQNGRYVRCYTVDEDLKPEPEPEPCTEDELTDFIIGKRGEEPT